ncbi:hypothetical protein B9Z55_003272 [Caenorhabditis nigoni]|nr:hypothetical protein B9Z55_003272 [Caenorhabditis nigoni]
MPTSNLMKHMQDCMKHPNRAALENFQAAYESKKPLSIAYDMLSLLEHKKTNPLKMAMETDPLKTTVTFDEWHNKIGAALGQFYFLELFASGLLKEEDEKQMFDSQMLTERSEELYRCMEGWKNEYKEESTYWPFLQKLLQDEISTSPEQDPKHKADQLRDKLSTILTNNSFYILIKPGKQRFLDRFSVADKTRNQYFFLDGKGKYQVFLWRRFPDIQHDEMNFNELAHIFDYMRANYLYFGFLLRSEDIEKFINQFPPVGFAISTCQGNNEERVVNCAKQFVLKQSYENVSQDFFVGML